MNRTKIEWVRNPDGSPGYTFNPITGCLNHIDGLCKGGNFPCYAYKLAYGRLRQRYLANDNISQERIWINGEPNKAGTALILTDPFYPRFWPSRLWDTYVKKPSGIFVCDMGELFGDWLPSQWQDAIFENIRCNPQHRFYLLTKQPQNLIKFSPFPENCFVGVTVTRFQWLTIACENLRDIDAKIKFLSFEPLFERMNVSFSPNTLLYQLTGIDWVIIGAQTKPYKPPKIEWVEEIVRACDKAGVPVFLKDNLWPLFDGSKYAVPLWAFDKESKLRQEIPVETDKA